MKQSIYNIFNKNSEMREKKVIIWGSGSGYYRWKDKIDFHAVAIIDNNKKLWGTRIDNIPILSPEILEKVEKNNFVVFILSFFYEEIKQQVISYGFEDTHIYSFKDLERTIFIQEKKKRQEGFQNENQLSLQSYIENLEYDFKDIIYKEVHLLPVVVPFFALITNYLFLKDSNSNLFPVPKEKEYRLNGNGSILVSFVWHEKRRPGHHKLICETISEIPKNMITEIKPISVYDDENEHELVSFSNKSVSLCNKDLILLIKGRIEDKKYCLLETEIDWFLDFVQYFINLIDQVYEFFKNKHYKVFVSGFANNSEENILVQVAKNLGIMTYGLQHGTFGEKHEFNKVPFSHVYKYPTVNELLLWGEYPKSIVKEIQVDKSKCSVIGNPRYNYTTEERRLIKQKRERFIRNTKFLVCFTGPGEREYTINQDLLSLADNIASMLKLKYIVKMHPENKVQGKEFYYIKENCECFITDNRDIVSIFEEVDFIITTSSTIIHEAVFQYIPTFVYDTHPAVKSICGTLPTTFKTSSQLELMCIKCKDNNYFNNILDEYELHGNLFFKTYKTNRPTMKYKEKILKTILNVE
ncbi:hypothetical protein [Heyndrickxia vini]|uniref:Uncharacterized protein n=1 Tax=Heyndrickxia vini TaxID=1476025 RepID=A0ABX7E4N6_9BACI|nr:hypothetical protein [Heyndrickxia vini]QQZ10275.1 hypothetical protein I5776_04770 [Heyndrickxia vini]